MAGSFLKMDGENERGEKVSILVCCQEVAFMSFVGSELVILWKHRDEASRINGHAGGAIFKLFNEWTKGNA